MHKADLASLIEAFFCKRLISQRRASPHTVASYRDTFRLLLVFAQERMHRPVSQLALKDIIPGLLNDFLDHLEAGRVNIARTRNLRLTAIRSFFRFAALEAPDQGGVIQRVLAIPNKRCQRPLIGFLTRPEIQALLGAVDCTKWIGRRDYAFLLIAMQTGLRLSELTGVRREDVTLGAGAHIHCVGKGRNYAKVVVMQRWSSGFCGKPILSLRLAGSVGRTKAGGICEKTGCFRFRSGTALLQECAGSSPHGGQPPWHNSEWLRTGFARARVHSWRDTPSRLGG
jgi:site-specific recombinase XerD